MNAVLAQREHFGKSDIHRLVSVCILLTVIMLGLALSVRSECEPPIIRSVIYTNEASVRLEWVHPQCFNQTTRTYAGVYAHPMIVGQDLPNPRIAIKLPACSSPTLLHSVNTYFIGEHDVSAASWSIHAAFAWSLHADSEGVPGSPICPAITSQIGEVAKLQHGGWYKQTLDWWLPDSLDGRLWIVGSWPALAQGVVCLGANNLPCPANVLAGFVDGGIAQWAVLDNGLLAELELLHSQPVAGSDPAMADSFRIIRELLSGPQSPRTDTSLAAPGTGLIWSDSTVIVGQSIRYTVAAPCTSGVMVTAQTPEVSIADRWLAGFIPESLMLQIQAASDTLCHVGITNHGVVALSVKLAPAPLGDPQSGSSKRPSVPTCLLPTPDSFSVTAGATQTVAISIPASDLPTGTYTAWLPALVTASVGGVMDRHALPISLTVDFTTSVQGEDSEEATIPIQRRQQGLLTVSARPNPFTGVVTLEWGLQEPDSGAKDGIIASGIREASSNAQVIVYNSLGNKIKDERVPVTVVAKGQGLSASLTINGTSRWPSGVYFVSVRFQGHSSTVKILHLK